MTQVLRFDGVNDYVQLPSAIPSMTGDWQLETKVTIRSTGDILLLGWSSAGRYISLRTGADMVRVTGSTGTAYDIPCVLNVGETCTINIIRTVSPSRITVLKNGVQAGQITFSQGIDNLEHIGRYLTTYSNFDLYYVRVWDATTNRHYSADGVTSGTVLPELINPVTSGNLVNFTGNPWVNDELFTLPTTIVPGVTFTSDVLTPFTNGAATISFGGVNVAVTIAGMQFTVAMPMFTDNTVYPKIPLTGTITLTQGGTVANIFRPIALPNDYSTLVDVNNVPANFANIISDDDEYVGWWFAQAGNPLTTSDNAYWLNTSGFKLFQDTSYEFPTAQAPEDIVLVVRRGADNKTYLHPMNVSEDVIVVGDPGKGIVRNLRRSIRRSLVKSLN
jgi:hypothetical protein